MAALKPPLGRAFLRLFTVQGSWNYERMIGIGMGVAEEPLLRDLPGGPEGQVYRAAVGRAAHFFNSHPYLAGLAAGAAARAEHDGQPPAYVERLRGALTGPLGSLGDRLVWAGWLPALAALAVAGVALGLGWTAVLAFLVLYNVGHFVLRWWALRAGWEYGARVAAALHHPALQRASALSGPAMALATGFAFPLAGTYLAAPLAPWARAGLAGLTAIGLLLLWKRPGNLTGLRLGLLLVAAGLIVGRLWR